MNFLLDHDVPDRIGDVLMQAGHTVRKLREVLPTEAEDLAVLAYAQANQFLLVTCNRDDFLDLARHHDHSGIIVLVRRQSRVAECAAFLRLIQNAGETGLADNINFA